MNIRRAHLLLAFAAIVVAVGGYAIHSDIRAHRRVVVVYNNSQNVRVLDITNRNENGADTVVATVKKSGDALRLKKSHTYLVAYAGTSGYADGFMPVTGSRVVIDPEYTEQGIERLLSQESGNIQGAIFSRIQNGTLYRLEDGTLLNHGTWYVSRLIPVNDPAHELDALRVIVKKSGDSWKLVDTPKIVFTTYNTLNVPTEVLNKANTYPN